jgi:nucleoid-associated protein YgaU
VSAADGSELHKVVMPVTYGRGLMDPYTGFLQYTVVAGDTLSGIARRFYGDPNQFHRIFEASRNQLHDPNRIFPGQVLRVPQ